MPIVDVAYKNRVLDACYGDGRAAGMPATVYLALFSADPTIGGEELTIGTGGYARVAIPNDTVNWPAASAGVKENALQQQFPASTGAWSAVAAYWCLMSAATGGEKMDSAKLAQPYTVDRAGIVVTAAAGAIRVKE